MVDKENKSTTSKSDILNEILFSIWDAAENDILNEYSVEILACIAKDYFKKGTADDLRVVKHIADLAGFLITIDNLKRSSGIHVHKQNNTVEIIAVNNPDNT